jgi:hypothetical protein
MENRDKEKSSHLDSCPDLPELIPVTCSHDPKFQYLTKHKIALPYGRLSDDTYVFLDHDSVTTRYQLVEDEQGNACSPVTHYLCYVYDMQGKMLRMEIKRK